MRFEILHRDELPEGGFAGLREHQLVMEPRAFGPSRAWKGIGDFIYLADARFMPRGETHLHNHHEVDVISVVLKGRIAHEGSLGHGENLEAPAIQVQRAGGEGFAHNEVNPDDEWNRMLQIWVLPETPGQPAGYKVYRPEASTTTRVYGGSGNGGDTFESHTIVDVAEIGVAESFTIEGDYMAYLAKGTGVANGELVTDGDLLRGTDLDLKVEEDVQLVVIQTID